MVENKFQRKLILAIFFCAINCRIVFSAPDPNRLQPFKEDPYYWQYNAKPVLLLGGSKDDNLFQIPDLESHLNEIKSAGGNYIRNVMSERDEGNAHPFKQLAGGKFDLDQWGDEYWNRFDNMLKLTQAREIFVQIEVWAFHDFNQGYWGDNPWNPDNNITYTLSNTNLKSFHGNIAKGKHDFLYSVPKLNNDVTLLNYQNQFVAKILSYSLKYNHVLYNMTNEIHENFSPEWGWYWSEFIKSKAKETEVDVETTEMFWQTDLEATQHRASFDHPERYSFVEISQNSVQNGEVHWNKIQWVRNYIKNTPRPVNNNKMYGSTEGGIFWTGTTEEVVARFWRNVIGGAASARFHRPNGGLGLNQNVKNCLKAARKLESLIKMWQVEPNLGLLTNRSENEAYLAANLGLQYALFFTGKGSVNIDLKTYSYPFALHWINVSTGEWGERDININGGEAAAISAPASGPWVAAIVKKGLTAIQPENFTSPLFRESKIGLKYLMRPADLRGPGHVYNVIGQKIYLFRSDIRRKNMISPGVVWQ